jgi:very-short-patch-repair endonuclease
MKDNKYWQSRCSKFRGELLKRQTKAELAFAELLQRNEIAYIPQKGFIANGRTCIVDFYIPKFKLCIEVDGEYHLEEKQMRYDYERDMYLTKTRNFGVLRVTNDQVLNCANEDEFVDAIKSVARGEIAFMREV